MALLFDIQDVSFFRFLQDFEFRTLLGGHGPVWGFGSVDFLWSLERFEGAKDLCAVVGL